LPAEWIGPRQPTVWLRCQSCPPYAPPYARPYAPPYAMSGPLGGNRNVQPMSVLHVLYGSPNGTVRKVYSSHAFNALIHNFCQSEPPQSVFLAIGPFEPAHCRTSTRIWRAVLTFLVGGSHPRRTWALHNGGRIVCGLAVWIYPRALFVPHLRFAMPRFAKIRGRTLKIDGRVEPRDFGNYSADGGEACA